MATASQRLAAFACALRHEDIPEEARHAARRFLLDTLGCLVGGFDEPQSRIAREVAVELGGPPEASLLLTPDRVSPAGAVLGNGVAVRALDLMDWYVGLDHIHPCELTVTPALALGERAAASGAELVTAVVLGYEVAMKLAEITGVTRRGWAGTATLGQLVAPVVAGRMLGLDSGQMAHAIGIAGAHHVALAETYLGRVSMLKDGMNALVAQGGVLAALLARRGFTGPAEVLEGPRGLWRQVGSDATADGLVGDLGAPFRIARCGLKDYRYAVMAWSHPVVEACVALREAHGLTAERVAAVRVRTFPRAARMYATGPVRPDFTRHDAQFNAAYIVAAALRFGDLAPGRLDAAGDPAVQALGARVTLEADPELEREVPPKCPAVVEIQTTDGRVVSHRVDYRRGDPGNPLTDADLETKFRCLVEPRLGPARTAAALDRIWHVERGGVRDLVAAFGPPNRPG